MISHLHLSTSIDIAAPPETVWAILSDLPAYGDWNPMIPSAEGALAVGERLTVRVTADEGKGTTFRPRVQTAAPARELRWLGRLLLPGVFDGEHRFAITPTAGGSRLVHEERFRGALVPFLARRLRATYVPAFERMNRALKARAEAA